MKVKKPKSTGQLTSQKRLEKFVTDITYLPFGGKTLYLSSVHDLFNGEIIAYTIFNTQNGILVLEKLQPLSRSFY
ncbi:hypothetical protein [Lysinibacillus sphaericus]|uniref:hypothetical protein n=1 Tax=Lysinibacillus sphaericus TaxID=1421 RepID=UPI00068E6F53|nr:hypothetical protein [Lysinibacillus sphaericus]QPA60624.1 hypothetical protein INQ55_09970 [Lysinibacillus sphaericus]